MRHEDDGLHPAARERKRRERRNTALGSLLIVCGAAVVVVPAVLGTLSLIAACAGTGLVIWGGLLVEPDVFKEVAMRAFDALPGGKH